MKNRKVATKASGKSVSSAKSASSKSAPKLTVKRGGATKTAASKSSVVRRTATSAKFGAPKSSAAKASAKVASTKISPAKTNGAKAVAAKASAAIVSKVAATKIAPAKFVANGNKNIHNAKLVKKGVVVMPVAPSAPAKVAPAVPMAIFRVGDKVVYPAHGVGVIDAIQTRKISTSEQSFYMLTVVETGMKIMVPVSQVDTVGLRRVVDSKTIDKVYDILRDRNVVTDTQTWNRRYREYTQKIKTGSVFEIASVIRDLIVLKGDKELSFGERKMLDTAQGLLVKEISIAKARSEDMVRAELLEMFQAV